MMRSLAIGLAFAAMATFAAAEEADDAPMQPAQRDGFVISSDACGASAYAHLLGEEYARVYDAALLPAHETIANVQHLRTLEYTPGRLNVVVGGEGRIIAIGCF